MQAHFPDYIYRREELYDYILNGSGNSFLLVKHFLNYYFLGSMREIRLYDWDMTKSWLILKYR